MRDLNSRSICLTEQDVRSQQGTPPQISFYGGSSHRADKHDVNTGDSDYKSGGLAAGAIITIPIGSQTKRNCDRSYELHLLTKKLELATLMFEQGLVDEDEIAGLIEQAKQILNLQSSPDKFVESCLHYDPFQSFGVIGCRSCLGYQGLYVCKNIFKKISSYYLIESKLFLLKA